MSPIKNVRTSVRSIVAGYFDGTVRIFNLVHGQMVLKLHPHTSSISAIHVPPKSMIKNQNGINPLQTSTF